MKGEEKEERRRKRLKREGGGKKRKEKRRSKNTGQRRFATPKTELTRRKHNTHEKCKKLSIFFVVTS